MARFIPAALIGLTAVGLLIGGVSPAWWITGLVPYSENGTSRARDIQ